MTSASNGRSSTGRRRAGDDARERPASGQASGILEAAIAFLHAEAAALLSAGSRPAVTAFTGPIGGAQLAGLLDKLQHGERFPQTIDGRLFTVVPFLGSYSLLLAFSGRTRLSSQQRHEIDLLVDVVSSGPEQREAENRRLLAVSDIQQSIAAQSPLSEIFRSIYERAAEEIDTPTFIAATYERGADTVTYAYVMQDGVERPASEFPPRPLGGPLADAIRTGQPQRIDDTEVLDAAGRGGVLGDGPRPVRSLLIVPMVQHNEVRGVVEAQSYRRAAFGKGDIYLLTTLANQAVVALESARLLAASREQVHRLTLLNQIATVTSRTEDAAAAADRALELIVRGLHGIDMGITWQVDTTERRLVQLATNGFAPEATPPAVLPLDDSTYAGRTALESQSLVLPLTSQTPLPPGSQRYVQDNRIKTLIEMPMLAGQRVIGVLTLGSLQEREVDPSELEFLETLAGEMGSALEAILLNVQRDAVRQRLLTVIENLPEAVVIADADGCINVHNRVAEQLWGHAPADITIEQLPSICGLHEPDGRPLPWRETPLARALLEGSATSSRELSIRRADGGEAPILSNCVPIRDHQGRITGAAEVFQDITKLKEIDRLKDDFVNTVSHELRTPTTTIRGGALTLLRRGDSLDESTKRQLLRDMSEEAERLHILVEDLLSLSRSQAGLLLTTEPIIPHRFVNHMILELGSRMGDHALTVRVPADLPMIEADPFCLEQIFRNLIENAVKFSPGGQRIEIEAEAGEGEVVFSILDRGRGIPAKDATRVFEPFYRSDEVISAGAQGAGLGLAVCQRFVRMQGGRIWMEPRPGGGTEVHFTIPTVGEGEPEDAGEDESSIGLA